MLRRARGLAFLRVTKAGFALSARFGTGCVVARLGDGSWSGPSAIGTVGASVGFQFGAQVADFLIVLNDDRALQSFSGGGAFSLGGQIGAVAGPVGASREGAASMTLDNLAPIYTYSISKGLFAGISIEGTEVAAFPLFEVLDGSDPTDYVQRVEPSPRGGAKMARALMDVVLGHGEASPACPQVGERGRGHTYTGLD